MVFPGLFTILAAVLFLPFLVKKVEEELEIFLFIMGCIAVTITSAWSTALIKEALSDPLKITLAVFIAGLIFRVFQKSVARNVNNFADLIGLRFFAFLVIVVLGILSSVITAIIAALVLVEIINCLTLDRKNEIVLVVLACFSIGLGAALTPIGEPLSTIAVAKLKGYPYHAGFFFLFKNLWRYIIPGIIVFGGLGIILMPKKRQINTGLKEDHAEGLKDIAIRTVKVYLFVMALVFLGRGFKPVIDVYISRMSYKELYWLNMILAIVDNATLTAVRNMPGFEFLHIRVSEL